MFTKAKNIDTAFRSFRTFTLVVIICCVQLSCFIIFESYQFAQKVQSTSYVLVNGKALEAIASDRKSNITVEAKDHISNFHHFFFTLDPDEQVIQSNLSKALYLSDGSARRQYDNLKEGGYYNNLIAANISQAITVDSVYLDLNQRPYYFRCYSTQHITRTTNITTRNLITEGYLREVARSDHNPHGFLIERWATLENKDIKVDNR